MLAGIGGSMVILALTRAVDVATTGLNLAPNARLGLVVSVFGILLAGAQPAVGALGDRIGRRPLLIGGMAVFAFATLLMPLATRFEALLGLRGLQGLALACTVPTSLAVIAALVPTQRRGRAMGLYATARMLGFGVGPLIGGAVLDYAGTTVTLLAAVVPGLLAATLVTAALDEPPALGPSTPSSNAGDEVRVLPFVALSSAFFVVAICVSLLIALEDTFTHRLDLSAFEFSVAFSALVFARLVSDATIGRWSDGGDRRRWIVTGLVLLAPATLACAWAPTIEWLTLARITMGIGMAFIASPAFALVGDLVESGVGRGSSVGIVTAGFGAGLGVGPISAALLADRLAFEVPFALCAGLALIVAVVLPVLVPMASTPREGSDSGESTEKTAP
jgi:MFS family permease